jgi:hypothetical protein
MIITVIIINNRVKRQLLWPVVLRHLKIKLIAIHIGCSVTCWSQGVATHQQTS